MRIVAISDTHMVHDDYGITEMPAIPDGDILIHAGDFSFRGRKHEIFKFSKWFHSLPHKHKILIAGNHDLGFEDHPNESLAILQGKDPSYWEAPLPNICTYLRDSEITIDGVRIYGAPWSPRFFDWAFNVDRGPLIKAKWDLIPDGIDVLVTHGPPMGFGDITVRDGRVGCEELALAIKRVKPKVHIFGHIHLGYGVYQDNGTVFVNASMCDETYYPANPPIVVDL